MKEIEKELEIQRMKKKKEEENSEELKKQIAMKEDYNKQRRKEIMEEGRKIQLDNDLFYQKMEKIKQDKIHELENLNIKSKYLVDLKKFKIQG